jgi:FkbM family methyltransferase
VKTYWHPEDALDLSAARDSAVGRLIRDQGAYEPEILALLDQLVASAPRALVVDVGSKIGYFPLALLARARARGAKPPRVIGIEPSSENFEIAQKLMVANNLDYELMNVAVGAVSGECPLFLSKRGDSSHSLVKGFREARGEEIVKVMPLDQLSEHIADELQPSLVVVKIDVEGAEIGVLEGARNFLARLRPIIVLEILPGRNEKEIELFMLGIEYSGFRWTGQNWQFTESVQGDSTYRYRDLLFMPNEVMGMVDTFSQPAPDQPDVPLLSTPRVEQARASLSLWAETLLECHGELQRNFRSAQMENEELLSGLEDARREVQDVWGQMNLIQAQRAEEQDDFARQLEELRRIAQEASTQVHEFQHAHLQLSSEREELVRELVAATAANEAHRLMLEQVFGSRSWRWTRVFRGGD